MTLLVTKVKCLGPSAAPANESCITGCANLACHELTRDREMLNEECLKPLGLTTYRPAKDISVPAQRIGDIAAGKRAITADTDLRLCRYIGLSDGWWLRGQANYDTAIARATMGDALSRISRCQLLAA